MGIDQIASGMPVAPDVARLRKAIKLEKGTTIPYADVEAVIGPRTGKRWRTITQSWIGALRREDRLIVVCVPLVGFRCLDSEGCVGHSDTRLRRASTQVRKAGAALVCANPMELDADGRKRYDHAVARTAAIQWAIEEGRRKEKALEECVKALEK